MAPSITLTENRCRMPPSAPPSPGSPSMPPTVSKRMIFLSTNSDYKDRNSPIVIATDDAVSSPGSFDATFFKTRRIFGVKDWCGKPNNDIFHAGKYAARQVEPRNTPTTVNAVFSLFQFWDGRAHRKFNGVGVFGPRDIAGDPQKRLIVLTARGNPSWVTWTSMTRAWLPRRSDLP